MHIYIYIYNVYIYIGKAYKTKSLQNKSEISDLFCKRFCSNLKCILSYIYRKLPMYIYIYTMYIYISETSDVYRKFTIYLVGFFVPTESVFCHIGNFRYISEIYDIFCKGFFVPTLECILSYIYIYRTNFIVKISSKKRCSKINDIFPNGAPYTRLCVFLQIQCFLPRSSFYEFFSNINLKTKDGSTVRYAGSLRYASIFAKKYDTLQGYAIFVMVRERNVGTLFEFAY